MAYRVLREPFLHFLLMGAGIFVLFALVGSNEPDSEAIDITQTDIEALERQFEAIWRRKPDGEELDALITNLVLEEVLVREARALRMDEQDPIVRNRLRQKMEFIATSAAGAASPTQEDLQEVYRAHSEEFRTPSQIAFEQVVLDPAFAAQAETTLIALNDGRKPEGLRNLTLLPSEVPLAPTVRIDGVFGTGFATALEPLPDGLWAGPVQSGYGLHLVRVTDRTPAELPDLADVEDKVLAKWREINQSEVRDAFVQGLQGKYQITVNNDQRAVN
ncbi:MULTISPECIES: peptidyl-prolyl cis-trans isomerase [unclassified Ruegeria]|uniref:peptidylprolyl isomerase n=1 Tax=unclassified Ruegeria TaxID=2625375 RepID=UPI0014895B36|nr:MULTISPECIES: peptidylprolyl isomerase [unclassified Ruegeria]NOD75863.1 hypothetical protein [Ruegeria sp. HKCCD4332]